MSPDITWQKLYNNASMEDMREMLHHVHRLINKLEDAKKVETSKSSGDVDFGLIKAQNDAQKFWRDIIKMITHQRKENV